MQRNVTKCIGIAGKAAPCGGAGPSRVQSLRGTSDAACNQEKNASGRWFAKVSSAGLLGLSLPSSHFADEVFQIAGFELRHGERLARREAS